MKHKLVAVFVEKTRISSMPMTNVGSDTPIRDTVKSIRDNHDSRCRAAYTPAGIPIIRARRAAKNDNSMVAGSRSAIISSTEREVWKDKPKSPLEARKRNRPY